MFPRRLAPKLVIVAKSLRCNLSTTNSVIRGRATSEATQDFVYKSQLKVFHKFEQAGLYVNPVIHGSPRHNNITDKDYINALTRRAILLNRSNAVVVYDHKRGNPWAVTNLSTILTPDNDVSRQSIVAIANLGLVASPLELYKRLAEAIKLTGLQQIDMAFFEIIDETMRGDHKIVSEATNAMKELVENGSIQSFGIKISVSPFIHHSPPIVTTYGDNNFLPMTTEDAMIDDSIAADFVLYTISPTIASPATHGLLDNPDALPEEEHQEASRTFTRIACDPLICMRGKGNPDISQEDLIAAAQAPIKPVPAPPVDALSEIELISKAILPPHVEENVAAALDQLCPQLASTPRLQDKALRTVFSVGVDMVLIDAELSALMGKLQLGPDDMLGPGDTEKLFGSFTLPEGLIKRYKTDVKNDKK